MKQASISLLSRLKDEFTPKHLLTSLITGLILGIGETFVALSFASLIFSGVAEDYFSYGVGIALISATLFLTVSTLTTSISGLVASTQDSPAVIMGIIVGEIFSAQVIAPEDALPTVLITIALITFLTGLFFVVMGTLKLGGLVRYIPYPVIGGFLSGTGWLLLQGSVGSMADYDLTLTNLPLLLQPDQLILWIPGVLFGLTLFFGLRKIKHSLALPGLMIGSLIVFYLAILVTGTSIVEATSQGLLIGDIFGEIIWQPPNPQWLRTINWDLILAGEGYTHFGVILLLSMVGLLLNTSGIELVTNQDSDINRELRSAGVSNMVSGLSGGLIGYPVLSLTVLSRRMGSRGRLSGIVAGLFCGVMLFVGSGLLAYIPKAFLGGMLLFLGLDLLSDWLIGAWPKLTRAEYAILTLILVVIATVDFLAGVGVGLTAMLILFVVNYGRINVIRHALSGSNHRSNVERPRLYNQLLHQKGHWLYILELQGYIFFGTANTLLDNIRQRLRDPDLQPPRFILFDFRLVNGLDSSATLSFSKIKQLVQPHEITLVYTHLTSQIQQQLEREVLDGKTDRVFPVLDYGVEWCEDQMIQTFESVGFSPKPKTLKTLLEESLPGNDAVSRLMSYLEPARVEEGHIVIQQGETPYGICFIEQGQVTVQLDLDTGQDIRLRKMTEGTIVGEIGMYLSQPATASVITNQPSVIYYLSSERLEQMNTNDPDIAIAFHKFMAKLLAERLVATSRSLTAWNR